MRGPPTAASAVPETTPSSSTAATAESESFPARSYWSLFLYLRCFGMRRRFYLECKFMIFAQIYQHVLAVADLAAHQPPRQRGFHFLLDGPFQRPRSESGV